MDCVKNGKPIPGIKDIHIELSKETPTESQSERPPKPWMEDSFILNSATSVVYREDAIDPSKDVDKEKKKESSPIDRPKSMLILPNLHPLE